MRVMASVLELAALKVIPEADTQPGFSHRLTTKLAQAGGHADLFRARFSIPILTFPLPLPLNVGLVLLFQGWGLLGSVSLRLVPAGRSDSKEDT